MAPDQILNMLNGNSSANPMRFKTLLDLTGLQPDTLNKVLDQLYEQRKINQASVTKDGNTQRMVWPTGVVGFIDDYYKKTAKTSPIIPPPRRDEIKPKLMEENMTQDMTQDLEVAEQTPKALAILNFIEANPVCNSAQISHGTGIVGPRAYIKAHIKRGSVLVTGEGRLDQYLQLAPNQTAEAIYNNGYTKPAAKPATSAKFDSDLGFYTDTGLIGETSIQQHIDALFMLLPDSATICITRNDGQLEIDIEAEVFGRSVAKSVQAHEVKETLGALHIVTVEMV